MLQVLPLLSLSAVKSSMNATLSGVSHEVESVRQSAGYPGLPGGAIAISQRAWCIEDAGVQTVYVGRTMLTSYAVDDKCGRNYAMAQLSRGKYATQQEVATAFGVSRCTVNRLCRRLDAEGIGGLVRKTRSDKTSGAVAVKVCRLRREGKRIREVSARTGVSERTVRTILSQAGLSAHDEKGAHQLRLAVDDSTGEELTAEPAAEATAGPAAEATAEPGGELKEKAPAEQSSTVSSEAVIETPTAGAEEEEEEESGRVVEERRKGMSAEQVHGLERVLAPTGRVPESTVVFESAEKVQGAGALLAIAVSGGELLASARSVYGKLRNGFYGLRCTVLGLLAMFCLEVKNGESLKSKDPVELGRLLGLDRLFEVKTLRRKLREVGWLNKAAAWHRRLSQQWVAQDRERVATLYVDGHTRAYYGKRKVAKGWVSRRRLCQPASSDTWVNDSGGAPLLRVTEEAHPALCKVLAEMAQDVRELIGEQARATVAFDRGGWSGAAFQQLVSAGFDFVTYQKGSLEPLPESAFRTYRVASPEAGGEETEYRLAEDRIMIANYGEARRIILLSEDGKQTPMVTNKEGTSAVSIVQELLGRWRQENCFKYMRAHYNLDALVDYGHEPASEREIPNPARKVLNRELRSARRKLKKLQSEYGEHRDDAVARQRLAVELEQQEQQVQSLREKRNALPPRAPLSLTSRADEERLSVERKLFTDVVKIAAYRADCALVELVDGHLARSQEEGHAFVRAAFRQRADLRVTDDLVEVAFEPMSAPRFTRALSALCAAVNATKPLFPETRYRLRFLVKDAPPM